MSDTIPPTPENMYIVHTPNTDAVPTSLPSSWHTMRLAKDVLPPLNAADDENRGVVLGLTHALPFFVQDETTYALTPDLVEGSYVLTMRDTTNWTADDYDTQGQKWVNLTNENTAKSETSPYLCFNSVLGDINPSINYDYWNGYHFIAPVGGVVFDGSENAVTGVTLDGETTVIVASSMDILDADNETQAVPFTVAIKYTAPTSDVITRDFEIDPFGSDNVATESGFIRLERSGAVSYVPPSSVPRRSAAPNIWDVSSGEQENLSDGRWYKIQIGARVFTELLDTNEPNAYLGVQRKFNPLNAYRTLDEQGSWFFKRYGQIPAARADPANAGWIVVVVLSAIVILAVLYNLVNPTTPVFRSLDRDSWPAILMLGGIAGVIVGSLNV